VSCRRLPRPSASAATLPVGETPLQAACRHLAAALEHASADPRTFESFVDVATSRLAKEWLRLLSRERRR
jgi:hypothetical protein